jgi:hypothetical protein
VSIFFRDKSEYATMKPGSKSPTQAPEAAPRKAPRKPATAGKSKVRRIPQALELDCKRCGEGFTWTVDEQEVHIRHGYPPPARCKSCRAPRMCYRCGVSGHLAAACPSQEVFCFAFMKGDCAAGDECPMKHDVVAQEIKMAQIRHWKKAQADKKREKKQKRDDKRIDAALAQVFNPDDYQEIRTERPQPDDDANTVVDSEFGGEDSNHRPQAQPEKSRANPAKGAPKAEAAERTEGRGEGKGKGKGAGKGKGKGNPEDEKDERPPRRKKATPAHTEESGDRRKTKRKRSGRGRGGGKSEDAPTNKKARRT